MNHHWRWSWSWQCNDDKNKRNISHVPRKCANFHWYTWHTGSGLPTWVGNPESSGLPILVICKQIMMMMMTMKRSHRPSQGSDIHCHALESKHFANLKLPLIGYFWTRGGLVERFSVGRRTQTHQRVQAWKSALMAGVCLFVCHSPVCLLYFCLSVECVFLFKYSFVGQM